MERSYDAFISYARDDQAVVEELIVTALERDGFRVWFDKRDAPAGISVPMLIADALDDCRHVIACLSDSYVTRNWTTHELTQSVYRDPTSRAAGTIPVLIAPVTLELPGYLAQLSRLDLTDPAAYAGEYGRLVRQLSSSRPAGPPVDPAEVLSATDDAFGHPDDPLLTLFHVRRATIGLAKVLHLRHVGPLPPDITLDRLIDVVLLSARTPPDAKAPLALLHTFCRQAVDGKIDDPLLTRDSSVPAVGALRMLVGWMFPDRPDLRTAESVWASLPLGGGLNERVIPGTPYRLREPRLGVNSLGPVHPGHDADRQEPVAVNLVVLPQSADDRFFEEAARFRRLSGPNIIAPRDAGRIVVDGERLGLYLVLPTLDGIDGQELLDRNGPLPPRAAVELALGIATALAGFHTADPPVVHGDIKPASAFVGRFGTVGVVCIGRQARPAGAPAPATDLFALRAVLAYLLTGTPDGGRGHPEAERWSARLAGCRTAQDAVRVLRDLPPGESLAAVVRRHLPDLTGDTRLRLLESTPIAARAAWPLGGDALLVWERGTRTLAVVRGGELAWRDDNPIPLRRVAAGSRGRFAAGGWNGAVRCFADGSPGASTRLDGAVGDLVYTDDGLLVGAWNRALCRIADDSTVLPLLAVDRGVHRIAVSGRADRFTVADQSGRLIGYGGDRRVDEMAAPEPVRDIAYAGNRLIVLGEESLWGVRLDGSRTEPTPAPGAFALHRLADPGQCLLLAAGSGAAGAAVTAWRIDESERRLTAFTLPPGERVLSVTPGGDRLTVSRAAGGCAYRRGDAEVHVWPDAVAAAVSADGRLVTVVRPERVELYEDTA
ncbi:TIR domain-containing protein [Dactylosporangium vinaceum]|uniref:TIR domain-containing protein n=1 Tax=Dactylosporangium vinaceum TaxID=53362 RepID=A0ABV5M0X9_9ACTN|nr:TIR domain-containing protein [Dactylosporangium vinaceum]UAB97222.1 TIR domain-containing protein [Dactylosporangium vinaceum]